MNMTQAQEWIAQLETAIAADKITRMQACEEVFAEIADGNHDAAVETFFYNFTR